MSKRFLMRCLIIFSFLLLATILKYRWGLDLCKFGRVHYWIILGLIVFIRDKKMQLWSASPILHLRPLFVYER